MLGEIVKYWQDITYPLFFMVPIPYLASLLARFLGDRFSASIEEERLEFVAEQLNCSTYKVFCVSGSGWNIERERIDGDFKAYVQYLRIPYYVRGIIAEVLATVNSDDGS